MKWVWNGYGDMTIQKSLKGTVQVEEYQERLRLRWRYSGKRYALAIGLPATKVNRKVAQQKSTQIEMDIASGHFDLTLKAYKPHTHNQPTQITGVELFEGFRGYKAKVLYARTLQKYNVLLRHLIRFFADKPAHTIMLSDAEKFADELGKHGLTPVSHREYLALLKAEWIWGSKNELVEVNPWEELPGRIKVPPKQMPKPFTRDEIGAIIQAFKTDRYGLPYADFVQFLFGTGCRISEVIGLRWKHLSENCSSVWIGESLSRGVRKSTKTNRARTVTLTPKLQTMLLARRPANPDPDGLVFPSPRGGAINNNNFRRRIWQPTLTRLEINYRKPYTTRPSLISHALDLGMNPVMVAQLTGHNVETLYQNYAGNVSSRPMLPEF